jgi:hypothetical protein
MLHAARTPPRFTEIGVIEEHEDYFVTLWRIHDSLQIVSRKLLWYWWFEQDYGNTWMPRSDPPSGRIHVISPDTACIIPYRELVRHFDGYSHSGTDINVCPPLFIPVGFFDDDIKIQYGFRTKKSGFVDVNPLKKNYSTVDPNGADLKCTLDDLPLFWRSRISEVAVVENPPNQLLLKRRNEAVLKTAWQHIQLPVEMLETSLRFKDSNNRRNISGELGRFNRFAASHKIRRMMTRKELSQQGRKLVRFTMSKLQTGGKLLRYLRGSTQ